MSRNPETLSHEDIVQEIDALKGTIQQQGQRVQELAQSLYRRTRRAPVDDTTSIYLTYANSMSRLAGAVGQLMTRTKRASNLLARLPAKGEGSSQPPDKKKPLKEFVVETQSPMEALISSYSSEVELESPIDNA